MKRIDYVIYKQGAGTHVKVYNAQLIGQKPWKGTETTDLKAGMMSKDSALFASDHRGVVVDFEFSCCVCFSFFISSCMTPVRRHIGGIPKSLSLQMEEGNYYEALQLYRTLQSRYLFHVQTVILLGTRLLESLKSRTNWSMTEL